MNSFKKVSLFVFILSAVVFLAVVQADKVHFGLDTCDKCIAKKAETGFDTLRWCVIDNFRACVQTVTTGAPTNYPTTCTGATLAAACNVAPANTPPENVNQELALMGGLDEKNCGGCLKAKMKFCVVPNDSLRMCVNSTTTDVEACKGESNGSNCLDATKVTEKTTTTTTTTTTSAPPAPAPTDCSKCIAEGAKDQKSVWCVIDKYMDCVDKTAAGTHKNCKDAKHQRTDCSKDFTKGGVRPQDSSCSAGFSALAIAAILGTQLLR